MLEENDNPLYRYQCNFQESVLISDIPIPEEICIALGERKIHNSLLADESCEVLAFSYLFPTGKFGYNVKRIYKLSPIKYFNQRLLSYTQLFASEADYIFYALSVTKQLKIDSTNNFKINIDLKKVCGRHVISQMLTNHFSETVKAFLSKDEAYQFMGNIKGTPAYWKKILFEVLNMAKQLGLPTFFMTLSCADLPWDKLISIIASFRGEILMQEEMDHMDFFYKMHLSES